MQDDDAKERNRSICRSVCWPPPFEPSPESAARDGEAHRQSTPQPRRGGNRPVRCRFASPSPRFSRRENPVTESAIFTLILIGGLQSPRTARPIIALFDGNRIIRNPLVGASPAFFGFAFVKAWSILALPYFSADKAPTRLPDILSLLPFDALFALFACTLAIASTRIIPEKLRSILFPAASTSLVASSLLLLAIYALGDSAFALMPAAIALGAFGTIGLSMLWIDFLSLFNPLRALFLNAGAVALSIVLRYCVAESSFPRIFIILAGFALLGSACYRVSWNRSSGERPRTHIAKVKATFPYKAALFVASYSFAYGLTSPFVAGMGGSTELRIIPALLVVALSFVDVKRADAKTLCSIAFPLMVCGMLVAALIPGVTPHVSFLLVDTSYAAMSMMIAAIACGISYSLGASAAWIFGMLVALQFAARSIGQFCNYLLGISANAAFIGGVVSLLAVAFIVVASIVMISEKSLFSDWGSHQADPSAVKDEFDGIPFLQMRIDSLSDAYGLTQRETDVLRRLAEKKPNAAIAAEMYIAPGTVKAHIQHIYQKMGIHTRKELMDLLGKGE